MSKIKRRKTKVTHVVNIENVYIINFDGSKSEEKGKNGFKKVYGIVVFVASTISLIGNISSFIEGVRLLKSLIGL